LESLIPKVEEQYENGEIGKGIGYVMDALRETNAYFQLNQPWVLARSSSTVGCYILFHSRSSFTKYKEMKKRLNTILYMTMESLRLSSLLLLPVIPKAASIALMRLGVPVSEQHTFSFGRSPGVFLFTSG